MVRVFLFVLAALVGFAPALAQSRATSNVVRQAAIDTLIAKRGFGPTYEWNDYDRLYQLTTRGEELLKSGNFESAVSILAEERRFSPGQLRSALRNFLSFVHTDQPSPPRVPYTELIKTAQALGDAQLGAQMVAVALGKMNESNCARGDMATILKSFELSVTQAWTIVDELICLNAIQDFLVHFPEASRAVALRSFGYGGMTRSESAALDEWRVRPENLALIAGDDRADLVADWRREHIASLLQFGLTDEAARFYQSLDLADRKSLYQLKDGLYWADVGGLRERAFQFDRVDQVASVALAFRLGGQGEVADDIGKQGISVLADRNWECVVKQRRDQCDKKSSHSARIMLLLMRYLAEAEATDPYFLVEAAVSSNTDGRMDEGEDYGIPYAFCTRLRDIRYRSICVGANPLGAWASEMQDPLRADTARLNAAIVRSHPDILSAKPKYEAAQRNLAKLSKAALPMLAMPETPERVDERLIDAFRAARPVLARLKRDDLARQIVVNRAGDRAFAQWSDGGSGATYRAIRALDGSWTVTEISNWIAD